jgi:hypothetical protein
MVLGIYDPTDYSTTTYTGYGRLIDWWQDLTEFSDGTGTIMNSPNIVEQLRVAMGTDVSGATLTNNISPGIKAVTDSTDDNTGNFYNFSTSQTQCSVSNDWCWNTGINGIRDEINSGRPFVWTVGGGAEGGHSLAAWGYTDDKYVITYNTWDCPGRDDWYYSKYNNESNIDLGFVDRIVPGGATWGHTDLLSPNGGEIWYIGDTYTISWYESDARTYSADLYYSLDGGAEWIYIDSVEPSGPGLKTYEWTIPYDVTETTKARVRIRNFSGSDPDWVYQAGDGSRGNFTIAAEQVDLTILSIVPSTTNPQINQTVTVTVTVKNQGTGNIGGTFFIDFYKDAGATGPTVGELSDIFCEINSLAAGATKTCTFKIAYASIGNYRIWAQVDSDVYIPESDETNNISGPVTIQVKTGTLISDLFVQSITTNPVSPQPNQSVDVTVAVRNQGTGHTANPFAIDFYSSRATAPSTGLAGDFRCYIYEGLEPGATATCINYDVAIKYPSAGSYNMWAQVDTDLDVTESNETNNILGQPITVCTPPAIPSLSTPANGAMGVSTIPALDWANVSGATSYDVQVCSNNTCSTVVTSANVVTSQWTVSPALAQGTQYYWRARANNSCGPGSYSAIWSFTTLLPGQLLGDLNNDTFVDISDVILDLRIALGLDPAVSCSNINGDATVDISDVILTLRMALGLDPKQPCT